MNMNDTVNGNDNGTDLQDFPEMEINGIFADIINENKEVNGKMEEDVEDEMNENENSNANHNGNTVTMAMAIQQTVAAVAVVVALTWEWIEVAYDNE